jgi:hypothetical protein
LYYEKKEKHHYALKLQDQIRGRHPSVGFDAGYRLQRAMDQRGAGGFAGTDPDGLNIAALVATLQSGKQLSPAEAAAIQNISAEANKDLTLLQTFYNDYKANPSAQTMQKIENVIADINQNLPALLQAAHINDPTLAARVTAGVNLILTTVTSFASLIPQTAAPSTARKTQRTVAIPKAKDLKKQWNQQVCAPTGNAGFDAAFTTCALR